MLASCFCCAAEEAGRGKHAHSLTSSLHAVCLALPGRVCAYRERSLTSCAGLCLTTNSRTSYLHTHTHKYTRTQGWSKHNEAHNPCHVKRMKALLCAETNCLCVRECGCAFGCKITPAKRAGIVPAMRTVKLACMRHLSTPVHSLMYVSRERVNLFPCTGALRALNGTCTHTCAH